MNDKTRKSVWKKVPPGRQVRKKYGWDEKDQVYRLSVELTKEQYSKLEDKGIEKGRFPTEHLKAHIRKWLK